MRLYDLVQAYTALANRGQMRNLIFDMDDRQGEPRAIFSKEAASLIGNIMSDPVARRLEFGHSNLFDLPSQTAIKTGTSTGYRDAWTIAYNDRFLVGLWMGNLNQQPMKEVTGSMGPAIVARAIFKKLNENHQAKALYLSPELEEKQVCFINHTLSASCQGKATRSEWFLRGQDLEELITLPQRPSAPQISFPTQGLIIAIDPRLPRKSQRISFTLENIGLTDDIKWELNGVQQENNDWPISPGAYNLKAYIWNRGQLKWQSRTRTFSVVRGY